jgi:hypothetical protein
MNEREETSQRGLGIEHFSKSDLIINSAQMRDAAVLNTFRWIPSALDTANVIRLAAEKMDMERKQKKQSTEIAEVEPNDSTCPDSERASKRSRLNSDALPTTSMLPNSDVLSTPQPSARHVHHETQNIPRVFTAPASRSFHFSNTFQSSYHP